MNETRNDRICLDDALEKVGKFGFSQRLLAFVCAISRTSGSTLVYAYAFLILPQKYECSPKNEENYASCDVEQVCQAIEEGPEKSQITYRLDTSYENYVQNWYSQMNLGCMSPTAGAQILSFFFLASICVGLFAFIPDRLGRKKTVLGALALSLLA